MDSTGFGSCWMTQTGIFDVEPSGSVLRCQLMNTLYLNLE